MVESSPTAQEQAADLLAKYSLEASGPVTVSETTMPPDPGHQNEVVDFDAMSASLIASASLDIGLDPRPWAGQRVAVYAFPLAQRTLGDEVTAYIYAHEDKVIGAYLVLKGYAPGIVSLADRTDFAPPGLGPTRLDFRDIKSVEVLGPLTSRGWERRSVLTGTAAVDFLRRVSEAKALKAEADVPNLGIGRDEQFMFIVTYVDGPVVRIRLITQAENGRTYLSIANWLFVPPPSIQPQVESLLGI